MKNVVFLFLITLFTPMFGLLQVPATAQERAGKQLPPATPMLSPAICGKGVFLLSLGEQQIGREEFEIKCQPQGYSASGHTQLKVATTAIDLNTTLDVDKAGEPLASSAKGSVNGQPFDQSVTVKGATAVTGTAGAKELPFAKGSSLVGGNIFYMLQFLLSHYDGTRGGLQELPVFPNLTARVERLARDEAVTNALVPSVRSASFDRYSVKLGMSASIIWVDSTGRIAVVAVPLQNFGAVREEYGAYVPSLKGIISASMKETGFDYSAPPGAPFTAEEITIPVKNFSLGGTLLLPKSSKPPYPAVITITGSGQQTRDEFLPIPGLEKYRPFRQIAEALAARGIAVLRVDDRATGKSTGADSLTTVTSADFADDVRAQVAYLRGRTDIDARRIALVGHSEGGVIAPMVAASDPQVAAIVLMAGTAKRGDEIILYQIGNAVDSDPTLTDEAKKKGHAEQQQMVRNLIEGGDTSKAPAELKNAWMKYFLTYDPLPTIEKVRRGVLILQGALDRQVTADQADMLEAAARRSGNKDVTKQVYANLNHLFLPAKTGAPSEYSSLSTNTIPDEVIVTLANWLVRELKVQ